ncbi:hypothetical protein CsSME_00005029 [Camellia sinensis var. sinensis]
MARPKTNHSNLSSFDPTSLSDTRPEITSSGGMSMRKNSMEKLVEASAAEAEATSAVWQAMQATSATLEETSMSDDNSQVAETASESSDTDLSQLRLPQTSRPSHRPVPASRPPQPCDPSCSSPLLLHFSLATLEIRAYWISVFCSHSHRRPLTSFSHEL